MSKIQYRYTGSHPQDFDVDGKVLMVEPGGKVELDLDGDDKQYSLLADDGLLLDINAKPKLAPENTTPGGNK